MRLFVSLLVLLPLSACYTYSPASYDAVKPPAEVALDLTSTGTVKYEPILGPRVEGVEGSVLSLSADSMQLGVRRVSFRGGASQAWSGEVLGVEKSAFDNLRVRKLSVAKSAVLAAGVGGMFALIAQANIFGFGDNNKEPEPDPRPNPPEN